MTRFKLMRRTDSHAAKIAAKVLASDGLRPATLMTKPTTEAYSREWTLQWAELIALAKAVRAQVPDSTHCKLCGGEFYRGIGTDRRGDAVFCSDKHRITFNSLSRFNSDLAPDEDWFNKYRHMKTTAVKKPTA